MKYKILNISLIIIMLLCFLNCFKPIQTNATEAKVEISNGKIILNSGFNSQDDAFQHIIKKYKTIIVFFSGMGAITMVGIFIYTFIKLGATAGNPMERQKCISGLIVTGIATALLGSTALFVGMFYNAFKD